VYTALYIAAAALSKLPAPAMLLSEHAGHLLALLPATADAAAISRGGTRLDMACRGLRLRLPAKLPGSAPGANSERGIGV
jgi:hypothetical protein